jgi:toxin ParE1/3/4
VHVVYRLAAGRDIAEARRWYDTKRLGLGREFRQAVRVVESLIKTHPDAFPKVHREVRRVLLTRFPFAVYYQRLDPDTVEIIGCLHTRRGPKVLHDRG